MDMAGCVKLMCFNISFSDRFYILNRHSAVDRDFCIPINYAP